ncbi:FecR family protein [Spirosoma harenae]
MNNLVNKQLIFDHFADRVTALQRRMIAEWLEQPDNRERYYEWLEEWEMQNPQYDVEVEATLQQSLGKLMAEEIPLFPQISRPAASRFFIPWQWAAVVAGIVLMGSLYVGRSYILYRSVQTSYGEVRKVVLPEGSIVTLNANSSIRYPRFGFGSKSRQVFLSGEANFDVKHLNDHKQFIVSTDHHFNVVVLGTEFNVFSRPRGAKVVLQRGKVEIVPTANPAARRITMKPGDLVSLDSTGYFSRKHLARPDVYAAWQEHRFEFDQTPLIEIARLLEDNYGMHVLIPDTALAQRTVSGTFSTRTAGELSQVIADLLEVNVSQKGNQITFVEP